MPNPPNIFQAGQGPTGSPRWNPPPINPYPLGQITNYVTLSDVALAMGRDNGGGYGGSMGTNVLGGAASSLAVTALLAASVGDLILISVVLNGNTQLNSATDSRGNVYTPDGQQRSSGVSVETWSSVLTTAIQVGDTFTVTFPANGTGAMVVDWFVGVSPAKIDAKATTTTTQTSTANWSVGPTPTLVWPWTIAIGVFGAKNTIPTTFAVTPGTGFTIASQAGNSSGATRIGIATEFNVLNSDTSPVTPTATSNAVANNVSEIAIGYIGVSPHTKQVVTRRTLLDTALAISDSLATSRQSQPSDTALNLTDAIATVRTRTLSDTALVMSDTLGTALPRVLADTALSVSDAIASLVRRPLSDTALAISDSLAAQQFRALSDTALSMSDSLATAQIQTLTDTALSLSDSLALLIRRPLADTALSLTDSLVAGAGRGLTDTALSISDAIGGLVVGRHLFDTALTITDSLRKRGAFVITDTALNVSDNLGAVFIPGTGTAQPPPTGWSPYPPVPWRPDEWWKRHHPPPESAPTYDEAEVLAVLGLI